MSCEDWEHLAAAIESVTTAVALIGGAFWAYVRFWRQREGHGRVDMTADLVFVARRGDQWIVEIIARLENKGLVRHWLDQLTFTTRYLLDGDALEFGEKDINYQLKFPHKGPSGRFFPKHWNGSFVEAGACNVYRFVTLVPANARLVLVYERFNYRDKNSQFFTSQRVFPVPPLEQASPPPPSETLLLPSRT